MTNKTFAITVMPGDGIGPEVMTSAVAVLDAVEKRHGLRFVREYVQGGSQVYKDTGVSMTEEGFQKAESADAVLFGAMGLPDVRYPDGTEPAPQLDLRFRMKLYAGVRPIRAIPGVPAVLASPRAPEIDFVLIRESTEGLFASRGKGTIENDERATDTMVITRDVTRRLSHFSFQYAKRRAERRGRRAKVTLIDKSNVFLSYAFMRRVFFETAKSYPEIDVRQHSVDATALDLIRRPWEFDVMTTENMFGDILSDLGAGLIGGMGFAPSADIGDDHALFQPCHGSAPDIAGQGVANPTAMILSAAMMLEWLGHRHDCQNCLDAALDIEKAVDTIFSLGDVRSVDIGGRDGTAAVTKATLTRLGQ